MPDRLLFLLVPVLVTAGFSLAGHDAAGRRPATGFAGPGAVLDAATGILRAIEQRDAEYLGRAFEAMGEGDGIDLECAKDGKLQDGKRTTEVVVQEVDADGRVVTASSVADAVARLAALAGKDAVVEHRLIAAHVDCPSAHCSWGSVAFERTVRRGDAVTVTPMRVTLLTRYRDTAPHMRTMVWHCSATR